MVAGNTPVGGWTAGNRKEEGRDRKGKRESSGERERKGGFPDLETYHSKISNIYKFTVNSNFHNFTYNFRIRTPVLAYHMSTDSV